MNSSRCARCSKVKVSVTPCSVASGIALTSVTAPLEVSVMRSPPAVMLKAGAGVMSSARPVAGLNRRCSERAREASKPTTSSSVALPIDQRSLPF